MIGTASLGARLAAKPLTLLLLGSMTFNVFLLYRISQVEQSIPDDSLEIATLQEQVAKMEAAVDGAATSDESTGAANLADHALDVAREAQAAAVSADAAAKKAQESADESLDKFSSLCISTSGRLCP